MLLMITKGPHEGSILNIQPEKPAVLGRRGSVPLLDSLASKRHACLYCDEQGHWYINDLGSTNGTFVNNEIIQGPVRLHNGDAVTVGKTSMVVGGVGGDPDFNHALIAPTQKAEQREIIVAANRAIAAPAPAAALGPPVEFIASPPQGAMGVMRRWMPVALMAVLLLIIVSQAAVYLRMQESIDGMRTQMSQQGAVGPQELLGAVEQKITAGADAQRVSLLQEVSSLLASQQEQQLAKLDDRMRARLAEHDAALQRRLKPQSSTPPASPDPWSGSAASAFDQPVQAVFFVDCSGSLPESLPVIHEEIAREMQRIEQKDQSWIFLFYADQLFEIPGMLLDSFPREHAGVMALLYARNPQIILHESVKSVGDALSAAMQRSPAQLFLMSDGLTRGVSSASETPQQALKRLNSRGRTRIHAIHFFSRDGGASLRAIARENQGSYSFIPARGG